MSPRTVMLRLAPSRFPIDARRLTVTTPVLESIVNDPSALLVRRVSDRVVGGVRIDAEASMPTTVPMSRFH